ncbi:MAG: hypothetical protein WD342_04755 [Verrucomicrobiales bacterium]
MSATLTIRNLDEEVKRKLRLRAASHQRSMEGTPWVRVRKIHIFRFGGSEGKWRNW